MENVISELESAIKANKNNKVLEWTITYLQKDKRNKSLLEDIKKRKIVKTELFEFPLSKLVKVSGPLDGEKKPEPLPEWVNRVKAIEKSIIAKLMPPPIIVTDFWQGLGIADGNHRQEALLKLGFIDYWTIFLFENLSSGGKLLTK